MKNTAIVIVAATFVISTAPAHSEVTQARNEETLLTSKACVDQVDEMYKRIHKLDKETKKGLKVYPPAVMKAIQDKLIETQQLLDSLTKSPL